MVTVQLINVFVFAYILVDFENATPRLNHNIFGTENIIVMNLSTLHRKVWEKGKHSRSGKVGEFGMSGKFEILAKV